MAAAVAVAAPPGPHEGVMEAQQQVLEEIVNTHSEDIDKIEVTEEVAEFFVRQRPFSARLYSARSRTDPWRCMNQAVRQMYSASVRGPRCRYFPGHRGPALPIDTFSMSRPATARQDRIEKLKHLKQREIELLREAEERAAKEVKIEEPETAKHFSRIEKRLTQKATVMMAADYGATVDAMEEELTKMAEVMVSEVLARVVQRLKIQNLAHILAQEAMEQAALDLGLVTPREQQ